MGGGEDWYPGTLTLREWARHGHVTPDTPLVDTRTGERLTAGEAPLLREIFAQLRATAPVTFGPAAVAAPEEGRGARSLDREALKCVDSPLVVPPRWTRATGGA